MDERDQRATCGECHRGLGQNAQGETVDHDRQTGGDRREPAVGLRHPLGIGQHFRQADQLAGPAAGLQFGQQPFVVKVAASPRLRVAGQREDQPLHAGRAPSKAAQAT